MSTTNKWLIGLGIVLLLVAMYALPFLLQGSSVPYGAGYGMMGGRGGMMQGGMMGAHGGMHGSMMGYNGFGLGYGLMWLFPLSLLALIGLSIAALIKYLRSA